MNMHTSVLLAFVVGPLKTHPQQHIICVSNARINCIAPVLTSHIAYFLMSVKLQKFANNPKIVDPVVGIVFNLLRCREAAVEFIRLDILKRTYMRA